MNRSSQKNANDARGEHRGDRSGSHEGGSEAGLGEYAQHMDYCRSLWAKRGGNKYEPALTAGDGGMGEYQDWDKPRVMERRKALRSHPIVQELIGQVEN